MDGGIVRSSSTTKLTTSSWSLFDIFVTSFVFKHELTTFGKVGYSRSLKPIYKVMRPVSIDA